MLQPLIEIVQDRGIQDVYPILILMAARPFGLMFGFLPLTWAFGRMRLVRMNVALALAFPVLVAFPDQVLILLETAAVGHLALILPKEVAIGYGLGFLASLPFVALQYAGAITDQFRGETDSGLTSPGGEPLHTFGLLYLIIGFAAAFGAGAMWAVVAALYDSYAVWPIAAAMPPLSLTAGAQAAELVGDTLWLAIRAATPMLVTLITVEAAAAGGARVAQRFGFYDMAFVLKNLVAVLLLPVAAWFLWNGMDPVLAQAIPALPAFGALFQ